MVSLKYVPQAIVSYEGTSVRTKYFLTTLVNSEERDSTLIIYGNIRRP